MEKLSTRNCPSLSEEQIQMLNCEGIVTLMDFILKDKTLISSAANLQLPQYEELQQQIVHSIRPVPVAATQLVQHYHREPLFSTGIKRLDEVLGGGLQGGEFMEIYGSYATGKTQMCLAIAAQFCDFRNEKFSVVYFDLKNDFRATRFLSFCGGSKDSLNNIEIIRSTNLVELISDLEEVKYEVSLHQNSFYSNLKLVIIDSVPMAVYPAVEDDNQSWRYYQERVIEKASQLAKLNHGIIFIFINNAVKSWINKKSGPQGNSYFGTTSTVTDSIKPAMGKYWLHKPNFRLHFSGNLDGTTSTRFSAVLEKSSRTESMKKFEFSVEKDKIES